MKQTPFSRNARVAPLAAVVRAVAPGPEVALFICRDLLVSGVLAGSSFFAEPLQVANFRAPNLRAVYRHCPSLKWKLKTLYL